MIEAYDMTLEAVITKLMWLMGREEQNMQKAFYTQINHDILLQREDKAGANKRGRVPDEWNTFLFLNI